VRGLTPMARPARARNAAIGISFMAP